MKKFIYLVSVFALIFTSCSNDNEKSSDDAILTQEGTLLRRVIDEINYTGSGKDTIDFNYSKGNKLKSIESKQEQVIKSEYTYTGDLITEMKEYHSDGLSTIETYSYDNQMRMIELKWHNLNSGFRGKSNVIYNDNTVKVLRYREIINSQYELIDSIKVFLLPNGDTQRKEQYIVVNGVNHTRTSVYTYDDKYSATNSILGFKKIVNWDSGMSPSSHNWISYEYSTTESTSIPIKHTSTYTYNSYGYPTTRRNERPMKYFYQ